MDCTVFCRALADETRQRLLVMLGEREMCVTDIVQAFRTSQPTISHHLNLLWQAGLLHRRKDGKQVYYSVNRDSVISCCGQLTATLTACPPPSEGIGGNPDAGD
jgi:DNA-binding transcriptional ArsR family regulator